MKNKQTNVGSFATAKLQAKRLRLLAIIAIVAVIGFSMTACELPDDEDNNSAPTPQTVTYSGTANGETYTLIITENTNGRYTAKNGDSYVLTVGTKKSTGTVTVNGSTLTLAPSSSGASAFTVTVSSSGITAMSGTITFDDGATQEAPATVTPTPPPTTGNPLEGTWLEEGGTTMTIAGNTITITSADEELFGSGTFTVNNNTITVNFTEGEEAGSTYNGTFSLSNNGNTLAMTIGGENTTWTKLEGTWVSSTRKTVLNNGGFTMSENNVEGYKGTYYTNGSNITFVITQLIGSVIAGDLGAENIGLVANQWYAEQQAGEAVIQFMVDAGKSHDEAETELASMLERFNPFATQTGPYTLSGNTLTISTNGGNPATFTRQ